MRPQYTPEEFAAAFWSKVNKTETCWYWTGAVDQVGRGKVFHTKTYHPAHRVAYELAHGPIPDGHYIVPTCDERLCVRPDHLVAVSRYQVVSETKRCALCDEEKPVDAFYSVGSTGRRDSYCIPCRKSYNTERQRERYATDDIYREYRDALSRKAANRRYAVDPVYRQKQLEKSRAQVAARKERSGRS